MLINLEDKCKYNEKVSDLSKDCNHYDQKNPFSSKKPEINDKILILSLSFIYDPA